MKFFEFEHTLCFSRHFTEELLNWCVFYTEPLQLEELFHKSPWMLSLKQVNLTVFIIFPHYFWLSWINCLHVLTFHLSDNTLWCNCSMRPLYRFITHNRNSKSEPNYSTLRCSKPESLKNKVFASLRESDLRCDFDSDEQSSIDYRTTPDVMFNKQIK